MFMGPRRPTYLTLHCPWSHGTLESARRISYMAASCGPASIHNLFVILRMILPNTQTGALTLVNVNDMNKRSGDGRNYCSSARGLPTGGWNFEWGLLLYEKRERRAMVAFAPQ